MAVDTESSAQSQSAQPLYKRIQDGIRSRISAGEWPQNSMLPSRRELCVEFKTTQVTLDKAIQGLIRDGVLRASRGSGTFVGTSGQLKRAHRIGVVIKRNPVNETLEEHWDNNYYFGPLFGGIRNAVMSARVEILYANIEQTEYASYFKDMLLDAMILVLPSLNDLQTLHELYDAGLPFVAAGFSTGDPADIDLPCVDTDNKGGAAMAVEHLVSLGHKDIGIIDLALSQANHYDRFEGFKDTTTKAGLTVAATNMVLYATYNVDRFETQIGRWLANAIESDTVPTALFIADYLMASATLRVIRQAGLRVPEDISIVAFDDNLAAAHISPPLTTIRQPVATIGQRAVTRLIEVLESTEENRKLGGVEILPTSLIVRESTAPPRPRD